MGNPFQYGEVALLWDTKKGKTYSVMLDSGAVVHTARGVVPHEHVAGREEGEEVVSHTGHQFLIYRPRVADRMMKVRRRTQIVYPKDAGWLIMALDLQPGARVIELGMGSGAFTILLAQMVGSQGKIYSFDRREDFMENALSNVARVGFSDRVEARLLNAGEPFPEKEVDAVFLDLPDPWLAVPPAYEALAAGRPIALLVPNAEQLKQAVGSLYQNGFTYVEAVELLERRMLVRQREGVRPSERMVGFTGYLASARKSSAKGGKESPLEEE